MNILFFQLFIRLIPKFQQIFPHPTEFILATALCRPIPACRANDTVPPCLADLYYQRWDVELFIRDIKTTMGMDILRCRTPSMVNKEILMHLITYNTIRLLMFDAAKAVQKAPRRISFKASIQALRQWEPQLNRKDRNEQELRRLMSLLRDAIAASMLTHRPGRREPRCRKRRPKPFPLLTAPRHQMKEVPHPNKYHAKPA